MRMSDQPTTTTDVAIRVFETTPAVVSFNYQEISDHLDGVLEKYRGLVFSDSDVAECKKTIAELRKGQKSLDEFRKATKKQLTESVTAFEAQCKVLYGKFEGVIEPLTKQQAQFELDRRELKRAEIQIVIDSLVEEHSLNEKYSSQLFGVEEYFNKGKTIKSIKTELSALANTLRIQQDKEAQDIDLIKTKVQLANAEYQLAPRNLTPEQYLRLLSYQSVAEIEKMIILDAQGAKKAFELSDAFDAAKAAEVPQVEEHFAPSPIETPSAENSETPSEVKMETILYEITGTDEQLTALEGYLDANDLSWIDRPDLQENEDDEEKDDDNDDFMS